MVTDHREWQKKNPKTTSAVSVSNK